MDNSSATDRQVSGGCACGNVRFHVAGDPVWTAGCCCRDCARATGSPYVVWVGFPKDSIAYDGAEPTVAETSRGVLRGFCNKCGTSLTYGRHADYDVEEALVYIAASTLDTPDRFPPTEVTWYSQRPQWFELKDTIPLHDATSPDQSERAYNSAKQRK